MRRTHFPQPVSVQHRGRLGSLIRNACDQVWGKIQWEENKVQRDRWRRPHRLSYQRWSEASSPPLCTSASLDAQSWGDPRGAGGTVPVHWLSQHLGFTQQNRRKQKADEVWVNEQNTLPDTHRDKHTTAWLFIPTSHRFMAQTEMHDHTSSLG